jgi:hypothetical protein
MSKHSSFASKSERCRSLDQIIARLGQGGMCRSKERGPSSFGAVLAPATVALIGALILGTFGAASWNGIFGGERSLRKAGIDW